MADSKVTVFINAAVQNNLPDQAGNTAAAGATTRIGGISESFYSNLVYNSQEMFDMMDEYCKRRARLLPNVCAIVAMRLQEYGKRAKTLVRYKTFSGSADTIGDIPQMALKLHAHSRTSGAERAIVIGAIPDARVLRGSYNPSQRFQEDLNAYCQWIQNNMFMRATVQDVPTFAITGIDSQGLLATAEDTTYVKDNIVQVMSSRDPRYKARGGYYKIVAKPTAKTMLLDGWQWGATTGGKVRIRTTAFEQLDVYDSDRVQPKAGVRKFGSPFDLFRGRA